MSQSLAQVYLHIIYHVSPTGPQIPSKLLNELHHYHAGYFKKHNSPAIAIGGIEDHVHILCRLDRTQAIAAVVQQIKKASSKWIKQQYATYPMLSKFHWQNGYGVFSVSHSKIDCVKDYILKQRDHHKTMTFREEYLLFLKKHNVEFNDKYLWNE